VLRKTLTDAFAKQGFASVELVTRWPEIVGAEIAAHSQPERITGRAAFRSHLMNQMRRNRYLLLRVEGPTAVEIQHLSGIILERGESVLRLAGGSETCGCGRHRCHAVTNAAGIAPDPAR